MNPVASVQSDLLTGTHPSSCTSQNNDYVNSHFTDPGDLWLIICLFVLCVFQQEENREVASNPPESSFQKLAPSETRYTILRDRDELWCHNRIETQPRTQQSAGAHPALPLPAQHLFS